MDLFVTPPQRVGDAEDLQAAGARSDRGGEEAGSGVRWIRSLEKSDSSAVRIEVERRFDVSVREGFGTSTSPPPAYWPRFVRAHSARNDGQPPTPIPRREQQRPVGVGGDSST